jgi:hypothetical protein
MNPITWNKRKATIAIALCVIISVSSIIFLQNNQTTQAALINPHPGLVSWWSFNEGTGTIAGDSSGNGNNGTVNGGTWVAGKYGQALSFNGVSNYVSVVDSLGLRLTTTDFTITAWIKYQSGTWAIISKGYGAHTANGYVMDVGGGAVHMRINNGVGSSVVVQSASLPIDTWTYVAAVIDRSGNGQIYLNGVPSGVPIDVSSKTNIGNAEPLYIGRYGTVSDFNGKIDEVQIYNRVLSAGEIQDNFQTNPDFSSNIIAKVPKGTTQVITTLSWQGTGSIEATITSPSGTYTEDSIPVYQKTTYSTTGDTSNMLNIKRLSISVSALSAEQSWTIALTFDKVCPYQITVEAQK